jgi:Uma2 family endonuclease
VDLSESNLLELVYPMQFVGDAMLEDDALLLLPTEDDLPDSDEKPVDNELQILAPTLLRAILTYIWGDRTDWFFAINLGLYHDVKKPAIGPDAFLSLGVPRVRPSNKLRLSYIVEREQVMPQWVLEVVSKKPGGEYDTKFQIYAEIGVLYYTIYNPSHYRRDRHEPFELYKLENGQYVRQVGNPIWMPELGLGIGHEVATQEGIGRDWLYWYDESGNRYPAPEDGLRRERILREQEQIAREREQLRRRELEEQLAQEIRSRRAFILRLLTRKFESIDELILTNVQNLTIAQLESLGAALFDFGSIDDLITWLGNQR